MTLSDSAPAPLTRGSRFHGRYEIVRCIKSGGMGAVYEVIHTETRRRCALKVMLPSLVIDTEMRARFQLETTVAADVHSEHIVETYDAGIDEATSTPFIVMELLRGEELASIVQRRGHLPPSETIQLLHQASLALNRTHAAGIVHRDLKPENLFVTARDDGSPRLKVLDFGIAKVVGRGVAASKSTRGLGTPLYMAPEQVRDGVGIGPATDIFALGHIAFALLVGEAYWEEEVQSCETLYPVLLKIAAGPEERATTRAARRKGVALPPAFDPWFARATAQGQTDRFSSASELVRSLAEVYSLAPHATPPVGVVVSPPSDPGSALAPAPHATDPSAPTVAQPPIPPPEASISGIASRTGASMPTQKRPLALLVVLAFGGLLAGVWWFATAPHGAPPPAIVAQPLPPDRASALTTQPVAAPTEAAIEPVASAPIDAPPAKVPHPPASARVPRGPRTSAPAKDPLDVR